MSSNGTTTGDGRRGKGAVVLVGATWRDRRIAQACNACQYGGCGVLRFRASGASAQNLADRSGPSRDVDNAHEGYSGFRNIYLGKTGNGDCTASHARMLGVLHHLQQQGGQIGERGKASADIDQATGAGRDWERRVSRFKPFEWKLFHERGVLGNQAESCHQEQGGPRSTWDVPARITACNAEHQDARGWPLKRQQLVGGWLPYWLWSKMHQFRRCHRSALRLFSLHRLTTLQVVIVRCAGGRFHLHDAAGHDLGWNNRNEVVRTSKMHHHETALAC